MGAVALGAAVVGVMEEGVADMAEGQGEAMGVAVVGGMGVGPARTQHHPGRLCLQASVPLRLCTAWTQGEAERLQMQLLTATLLCCSAVVAMPFGG